MRNGKRGKYMLEFKQEAARLAESGQRQTEAARSLGVVEQTLGNWVREHRAGPLQGASSKPQVTAVQMENSRLRAELARVMMERDILGKAAADRALLVSVSGYYEHLAPRVDIAQRATSQGVTRSCKHVLPTKISHGTPKKLDRPDC